jgi:hypothetical protein
LLEHCIFLSNFLVLLFEVMEGGVLPALMSLDGNGLN